MASAAENALRSLVGNGNAMRRTVRLQPIRELHELETQDDMVGSIVSRLVADIMGNGLQLSYNEFGTAREVDERQQRQFSDSWTPFAHELARHLLIYGWAVVRRPEQYARRAANSSAKRGRKRAAPMDDNDNDNDDSSSSSSDDDSTGSGGMDTGMTTARINSLASGSALTSTGRAAESALSQQADVPFVLAPWLYTLEWEDSVSNPRDYVAIDQNKRRLTDVVVIVHSHPDGITGAPTSVTSRCMRPLLERRALLKELTYAAHWAAHTTWAVQSVGASATPDPNDLDAYAEGTINGEQVLYERTMQQAGAHTFEQAVGNIRHVGAMQRAAQSAAGGVIENAMLNAPGAPHNNAPFDRTLVLAPGRQVASTPTPTVPASLMAGVLEHNSSIYNVFGVPPELLAGSGKQFASEGERTMRLYDSKLQEWQSVIENELSRTYNMLYDDKFMRYAKQLDRMLRAEAGTTPDGGGSFAGADAASAAASSPSGGTAALSKSKSARALLHYEVRRGVKAQVSIVRRSFASVENVMLLHDRYYISEQDAATLAVIAAGVSQRFVMSEKDRVRERERQFALQLDETERTAKVEAAAAPKPGGGAAKKPKAKKPAAKKAAASSSSDK